jgi:lipoate-protein ligase A
MVNACSLRLLMDAPRSGVENMAIDEAMLLSADAGGEATLRLYAWSEPTVSLGYFQKWGEWRGQASPLVALPAVRRITGGGAIVHADELTYSLALPLAGPHLAALGGGEHVTGLYQGFHAAIAGAAVRLGAQAGALSPAGREVKTAAGGGHADEPFLCFARRSRYDLVAAGRKVVGSAQRCLSRAVLQHGSVILRANGAESGPAGLADALGRAVTWDELAQALLAELAHRGLNLQRGELNPPEQAGLDSLLAKHRSKAWLELR